MKQNRLFIAISLALLVFTGCIDLDTYPEGKINTEKQKEEAISLDPQKAEAGVNGVFAQFLNTGKISSGHNDFGYPALMIQFDANGCDVVAPDVGYNWFNDPLLFKDRTATSVSSRFIWDNMYKIIYSANSVLSANNLESEDPVIQFYIAQAYAARSFAYWILAQNYQFNYVGNESKPCVPLVTVENMKTVDLEGVPRSSVKDVYTLIFNDINKAIDLIEKSSQKPKDKRYISKATAYGLRARYNLTTHLYKEAAEDADKAINEFSGRPYSREAVSVPTFIDSNDNAWMWGIVVTPLDVSVVSKLKNFPAHMGPFSFGYAEDIGGRLINKKLFAEIPTTDVRKGWWLDGNRKSANLKEEHYKYLDKMGYLAYCSVKYAPYNNEIGTGVNSSDIPLMRVEEMYLIKAEGLAMSGNTSEAKSVLESFIKEYRDPEYTSKANSAEAIQDEVFFQRRIELWGEGMNWFDILRLNKGIDRRGAGYPDPTSVLNIQPKDQALIYLIPEAEIQSNLQISDNDNNPAPRIPVAVPDIE